MKDALGPLPWETAFTLLMVAILVIWGITELVKWLRGVKSRYEPVGFQDGGPWMKAFRDRDINNSTGERNNGAILTGPFQSG